MKNVKDILVSALALMIIAAAVTAALAGTNALTEDIIKKQVEAAETAARKDVIAADTFRQGMVLVDGDEVTYYTAYVNDVTVGYVFTTVANGKSAGLTVMIGIDNNGVITGVKVTEDNETAGYVDKVIKAGYLNSFQNKPAKALTFKQDVDAVSQATKTSKGICDAVNKAITTYQAIKRGTTDGQ